MAEIINVGRLSGVGLVFPEGAVMATPNGDSIFALNLEAATLFFQELAIKKMDILNNGMGVYSVIPIGRNLSAKYQGLTVPRHLLTSRGNCDVWTPKGRMYFRPQEIPTYPFEYMGEQCADSFFDNCMEKILPGGGMVNDISATPEGQALLGQMIENIFVGLGNSFYDVVAFSQDDFIDDSVTGNWWATAPHRVETAASWADFLDQMTSTSLQGHITQIETAKAAGEANFNVSIPIADLDATDYSVYDGTDITALFDSCIRAAKPELKQMVRRRQGGFGTAFLVHPSEFEAYEQYLVSNYTAIPEGYMLLIDGTPVPGVLTYKGIPVIAMDEWGMYDATVGIYSHRVVLTALGNLVIAHNMEALASQYNGLGFVARQTADLSKKGKYEMYTTFRLGAAIANTDLMVNASIVVDPDGNELSY